MDAAGYWRDALANWAIPPEILSLAPESPWIHPPVLFGVPEVIEDTPSHAHAREVLSGESSVLDVGCGGGVAAFALSPPASTLVGVDHQPEMLELFRKAAQVRGVAVQTIEGYWPAVADRAPLVDVVTAHHVVYNVADIVPFVRALAEHATRRVVLELPTRHPLSSLSHAWQYFWGLERPESPTSDDFLVVLEEMGLDAHSEYFVRNVRGDNDLDQAARFLRIRLCLGAERDDEVREYLLAHPTPTERELVAVWFDLTQ